MSVVGALFAVALAAPDVPVDELSRCELTPPIADRRGTSLRMAVEEWRNPSVCVRLSPASRRGEATFAVYRTNAQWAPYRLVYRKHLAARAAAGIVDGLHSTGLLDLPSAFPPCVVADELIVVADGGLAVLRLREGSRTTRIDRLLSYDGQYRRLCADDGDRKIEAAIRHTLAITGFLKSPYCRRSPRDAWCVSGDPRRGP